MDSTASNSTAYTNKRWVFPLVLPFLLYSLAQLLSSHLIVDGRVLVVYDLELAAISAVLVLFGYRAVPGLILLSVFSLLFRSSTESYELLGYLIAAFISYFFYARFTGWRSASSFGRITLTTQRIIWLCLCNAVLNTLFSELICLLTMPHTGSGMVCDHIFNAETLVRIQGVMNGCITGIPLFYTALRIICRPKYAAVCQKSVLAQLSENVGYTRFSAWALSLLILMVCLNIPFKDNIFFTFYSLILIFPLMLWSSVRIGYIFTAPVWTVMMIVLAKNNVNYIAVNDDFMLHQVLVSTAIFIFTLTIVIMGVLARFNTLRIEQLLNMGLTDPMTNMPNLRALKADIQASPDSTVCLIQVPEMELFSRRYGLHFRARYQKKLAEHLRLKLNFDEKVYYHAGYGLLLKLEQPSWGRLSILYKSANTFRYSHNNQQLGFRSGLGYCRATQFCNDVYSLTGKLGIVSGLSLVNGKPENLEAQSSRIHESYIVGRTDIRTVLQKTLDNDAFVLMAQPIVSTCGEPRYHEILLRMLDEEGRFIPPDRFLPVATEAGLAPDIDLWVIRNTLKTMQLHPEHCFSINLAPVTVCRASFVHHVQLLLTEFGVDPHRIIFEITEADALSDTEQSQNTVRSLKSLGCRVAIDDFGTGFSSHARLMDVSADILKIDGSFIREITDNEVSHYIVESFCHVAKMKNMQVVAEYVENEKIQRCLENMNVDWLQGYHIGKPVPLLTLI
ncbi:EAL domain-containing protein (putative c-di-GMP-specific phosphodiesterase class I) [Buttiauxella sp. BIGb0471]|uniref:sensor domain-containing phosphodiesterase n=1 Tax=Buttiauxella sp. BIGb0471 TaxID=2940597 RepID=UPI00216727E0|nr:EAL domain-containing protein [Buttiauxella sp. BIGb0471]MCS3603131.1 EAL domain-containing protein (putative c-di-GMP-specific phosphodiesterase class I) [Buttiauxella sp. BIGb0471]